MALAACQRQWGGCTMPANGQWAMGNGHRLRSRLEINPDKWRPLAPRMHCTFKCVNWVLRIVFRHFAERLVFCFWLPFVCSVCVWCSVFCVLCSMFCVQNSSFSLFFVEGARHSTTQIKVKWSNETHETLASDRDYPSNPKSNQNLG